MKPSGRIIDDFLFLTGLLFTLLCVLDVFYSLTTGATRNFLSGICLGIGLSFMFIGWSREGRFRYSWRRGVLVGMPVSSFVGVVILGAALSYSFANPSLLDSAHTVVIGTGIIVSLTLIALGIRRAAATEISSVDQQKYP